MLSFYEVAEQMALQANPAQQGMPQQAPPMAAQPQVPPDPTQIKPDPSKKPGSPEPEQPMVGKLSLKHMTVNLKGKKLWFHKDGNSFDLELKSSQVADLTSKFQGMMQADSAADIGQPVPQQG